MGSIYALHCVKSVQIRVFFWSVFSRIWILFTQCWESQAKWNFVTQLQRFFSMMLLVVCDADYCFTLFDLGSYGSNIDCGVLANSLLGKGLESNKTQLPPDEPLDGCAFSLLPYYLLGWRHLSPEKTISFQAFTSVSFSLYPLRKLSKITGN